MINENSGILGGLGPNKLTLKWSHKLLSETSLGINKGEEKSQQKTPSQIIKGNIRCQKKYCICCNQDAPITFC